MDIRSYLAMESFCISDTNIFNKLVKNLAFLINGQPWKINSRINNNYVVLVFFSSHLQIWLLKMQSLWQWKGILNKKHWNLLVSPWGYVHMCQNNSSVNFLPGIARSAVILQFGGPLLAKMAFIPLSGVPVSWSAHQQYLWHCTILNLPSGVHCGIYIPPFGSTDCWLREDACSSKQLFLMTINYIFYLIYIVINKSVHIWKVIDDKKQSQFFFISFGDWSMWHHSFALTGSRCDKPTCVE